jgi:queuine/archaeosine tRNA-ribosyltransferase
VSALLGVALATAISRLYPSQLLSVEISQRKSLFERHKNLEEMKQNVEQSVASIYPDTLSKVTRNTLRRRKRVFEKMVDIFSICSKAVLQVLRN